MDEKKVLKMYKTLDFDNKRKRAYKPEILLSITKDAYGRIKIEPTKLLEKLEFEVFDPHGHGSQDEAIFLDRMGIRIFPDQLEDLIAILSIRINEHYLGRGNFDEWEKDYKEELKRIRKILVRDKELLIKHEPKKLNKGEKNE